MLNNNNIPYMLIYFVLYVFLPFQFIILLEQFEMKIYNLKQ